MRGEGEEEEEVADLALALRMARIQRALDSDDSAAITSSTME